MVFKRRFKLGSCRRNKRPQASDEKRAEIVAAARELFVDAGYDATPMGRLATVAGVAANTIYWYFADKDAVLIAVLDEVMADAWAQYQSVAAEPLPVRLLWVVRQLQQMSRLVSTVHARAERSPAIAVWHDNFHLLTSSLVPLELENAARPDGTAGRRSDDRYLHRRGTAHAPPRRGPATCHLQHPGRALDPGTPRAVGARTKAGPF